MGYYELSRLLAKIESLQSQYEQASKAHQDEAVLRELLIKLESALAQTARLQARFAGSQQRAETARQDAERGSILPTSAVTGHTGGRWMLFSSGPVAAILYMWVGGFWIWVLIEVLSDQYPAIKAVSTAFIH